MRRFLRVALWTLLGGATLSSCEAFDDSERRAQRTAGAFAEALRQGDSLALAHLAASGSAHNSLCAARHWPPSLTGQDDSAARIRPVESLPGDTTWWFRVYGERLVGDTGRAAYELAIRHRDPEHVRSFAVIRGANPGDSAFVACIENPHK